MIPASMGVAGAVNGIPVYEDPRIPYDEMYVSDREAAILVGDLDQFKYRMEQHRLNNLCRIAATKKIEELAEEMLGEPWKCQSSSVH